MIEKASVKNQPPRSKGKTVFHTSVTPSNITYPTDTKLMEKIRQFLVEDIIKSYQKKVDQDHRHYGKTARNEFVGFNKNRKATKSVIRKMKKRQLQFLKRNLKQASEVIKSLTLESKQEKKNIKTLRVKLQVAQIVYHQQLIMPHDLLNTLV